jgi:hypothetical protein
VGYKREGRGWEIKGKEIGKRIRGGGEGDERRREEGE